MNRRLLVSGIAASLPVAGMAQSTPAIPAPDAKLLLSDYLYLVVNQGDLSSIDTLFDRETVDVEAVRAFHAAEIERLAKEGRRPSSILNVTCAEGAYVMAQGYRSRVPVYYVLKAAGGKIAELVISSIDESVVF